MNRLPALLGPVAALALPVACFYLTDQDAMDSPPGSLWRVTAAGEVPESAELARTVRQ